MKSKVVFSLTVVVLLVLLSIGKCQEWVPYVPSSQSVSLKFWVLDGISYINGSIEFDNPCYEVDWGTVAREDYEIWVDSMIWDWTGGCVDMPITLSHTYDLPPLEEGNYTFTFMAWSVSVKSINFTAPDTKPPAIDILSPQNIIYSLRPGEPPIPIPLTFTVNETTPWIGYSLDRQENVTITGNTTLTDLSYGMHSVTVYANDTAGNMGSSETIYFAEAIDGDVNGDGVVNILDIVLCAIHFGEIPIPRMPIIVDLNHDGIINILDILKIAVNFGKTW